MVANKKMKIIFQSIIDDKNDKKLKDDNGIIEVIIPSLYRFLLDKPTNPIIGTRFRVMGRKFIVYNDWYNEIQKKIFRKNLFNQIIVNIENSKYHVQNVSVWYRLCPNPFNNI